MHYRNLDIEKDPATGRFIARSCDGDDFHLVSISLPRLWKAIDQLWDALRYFDGDVMKSIDIESLPLPGWIRQFLRSNANKIDIDRAFAAGQL